MKICLRCSRLTQCYFCMQISVCQHLSLPLPHSIQLFYNMLYSSYWNLCLEAWESIFAMIKVGLIGRRMHAFWNCVWLYNYIDETLSYSWKGYPDLSLFRLGFIWILFVNLTYFSVQLFSGLLQWNRFKKTNICHELA